MPIMEARNRHILAGLVVLSMAARAHAQTFDAVSIKPARPDAVMRMQGCRGGPGSTDPGLITCENAPLSTLILNAYDVTSYQLSAPDWTATTRFDVVAKAPPNATKEQVSAAWQLVLAERFHLAIHHEARESATYALVIGKGGSKLTASPPDNPANRTVPHSACNVVHVGTGKMDMASLARILSTFAGRPVSEETGLKGTYFVSLEFEREGMAARVPECQALPSVFAAVEEQLGLKLESRKVPVDILVVDHVERTPTGN
jgi:uncharacterized protein (TIGR03435 family)